MVVTFGSLFSGIGGLDMAVEACGWEPTWQVEQDSFCTKVLERQWPDVRRYGDIRQVDWRSVERVGLVCGGFPCQPFSVAGQNRGEDDERNMWPETLRAVRELGPRYVFLENVPGLLAHEYFGRILGDLAEGGYDAVWDTFTAAEVGAPHRRERLFILAYAGHGTGGSEQRQQQGGGTQEPRRPSSLAHTSIDIRGASGHDGRESSDRTGDRDVGHPEGERGTSGTKPAVQRRQASVGLTGGSVANAELARQRQVEQSSSWPSSSGESVGILSPLANAAGSRQRAGLRDNDARHPDALGSFPPGPDDRDAWARVLAEVPEVEPAVCRVAARISDRTHRLRALGNAVVPAQGAYALRSLWQRMMAL